MHASPGKFLRLKFSKMQSSAFWTLRFSKMPGFHIELVMLKYFINHRCRCGQRSNSHFLMLPQAEAIAARAQPPGKDNVLIIKIH